MSGQGMQAWSLADMFTLLANQVREQKSWAGTVTWHRQPAVAVEGDEPLAYTVVSISYADGDEGIVTRVVGVEPAADVDAVHLSERIMLREAVTDLRAQAIRERMVNDIARANVMLGTDEVHDLADHGMFHVEHLLAEIEGLNARLAERDG